MANCVPGRRYVRPYYFEFISHVIRLIPAKKRWAGKTIVDLFADEFKGRSYDYYVRRIYSCRHEPPVLAGDVLVLQNEADILTVYKPASVPVSMSGAANFS
ncbi:hypothetical protein GW17_00040017 [Ensete ventricosum]|nr:hypothetical protein GW17_00040017 [Ensete ventricosum]